MTVELVDDGTGLPAAVFGDDGVSPFPATLTTGGTFTDGVKIYVFPSGRYRFPYVPAGTYRLVVTPPVGFLAPTSVADPVLQALPAAPFALSGASRGLPFALATACALPRRGYLTGGVWLEHAGGCGAGCARSEAARAGRPE